MISKSEAIAKEFGSRAGGLIVMYVIVLAILDLSALLQLNSRIPVWVHVTITLTLSIVALCVSVISMRLKDKQGNARSMTIAKLVDDVDRLMRHK